MYREFAVASPLATALAGVVEAVWVRDPVRATKTAGTDTAGTDTAGTDTAGTDTAGTDRVLPDGCTDLIWVDGELLVAGPDTRAHLSTARPRSTYVAVRFAPGAGPAVLGVPAAELRDSRVPLAALWPAAEVRRLADRIGDAGDRPGLLQAAVATRLARGRATPDPVVAAIARHQLAGRSVAATADALGLTERQVHRRSLPAFGYGPKTLARILRFRRAMALARRGTAFAEVAVHAGYADQAHLAREVRALSGLPLRTLLR
jgi:AraC-like DNA-binding protein